MKLISFRNFLMTLFSMTCLLFIALVIIIAILFRNFLGKYNLQNINLLGSKDMFSIDTQNTHLGLKDKNIIVKFAIISDTESDWEALKSALNKIKGENVVYVFHLGDITQLGVPEDLQKAKGIFAESGLDVYSIPGDRDLWKSKGIDGYNLAMGEDYGYRMVSGINILLINNSDEYEGIGQEQFNYISENINNSDFVMLHNPIHFDAFPLVGSKGMGEYSEEVNDQRLALLGMIRNSTVKAVFAGDQHFFREAVDLERPGLYYYFMGALTQKRQIQLPSYAVVTVYEDGDYTVTKTPL
ncbi:hypothetical protein A2982_00060 [candidate division WWE3 bacterium RIFCSPLOWO2_01_FULL_39_13]|uniref:Calcineurin-like phosphoesterase domain-containing protein n=1 Tax=candidate division WWE3 bacterium RIFCSPLOWO2_01_FULL_39_13 TaxID=1802624 RepID=A0A1F4V465_UNCKA|nr:MAG: hypothetical protein A2982_00060 [candidate division WWE3 bacterium RIFCSPLOWO2_01_FULL_39_13]